MSEPASTARQSPLTDLRSVSGSLVFHALVLLVASIAAVSVATLPRPPAPVAVRAEIGPVDNRVPAGTGGGAPGELGGAGTAGSMRFDVKERSRRDASAEALLDEALLKPPAPDSAPLAPSETFTGGTGLFAGVGAGGGGGSGGGVGGGIGRGVGPSTEFFGARERAASFTYVIDVSGSMSEYHALDLAKRELLASLEQLPPDARFGVLFYNLQVFELTDPQGRPGLMPATQANKQRVHDRLAIVKADGGTDPKKALYAAFAQHPEVVFFLSDGQELTKEAVTELQAAAGSTRVLSIEFGSGPNPGTTDQLQRLSAATGGSYRYIDVTRFRPRGE